MRGGLMVTLSAALALACGGSMPDMTPKPPPAALAEVVGNWAAATATDTYALEIAPEGHVHYERQGSMSSSLEVPITAWREAEFDAGLGFVGTTFHITAAPHQDAGVWKMTVDGVEYQRLDAVPVDVPVVDDEPAVLAP